MRATTKLRVQPEHELDIVLQLTVAEARGMQSDLQKMTPTRTIASSRWLAVLENSLQKAFIAYGSEDDTGDAA